MNITDAQLESILAKMQDGRRAQRVQVREAKLQAKSKTQQP